MENSKIVVLGLIEICMFHGHSILAIFVNFDDDDDEGHLPKNQAFASQKTNSDN